jgi:threonylcarbamoyladenosine tRNA methylthiotransferase MtaB
MRIFLESLGCRLNYAEMASLGRQLAGAGHELAGSAAEADLCVLNSCAVTGESARLIVTGCYATLEGETVAQLPNVELVVGNDRKEELLGLITKRVFGIGYWEQAASIPQTNTQYPIPNTAFVSRTRAFIKVQDGCRNHCTFCIVTVARGEERSRPVAEVVAEANALHAEGCQEAVLTGVHLGGYGSDSAPGLRTLVAALLAETDIPRLRLSSLEPFDISESFFDLWPESDGRLMPHLHLPAQSGSDAVLRRMARRNRAADFEALARAARARIPGLALTTDLIAGFPGETESDFAETVAFARRVGFAHIHAFPYSARQGTAAARFGGQVPEPERKRRVRALNDLDAELGRAVRASFVGDTRPVLWERRHDAPPALRSWGESDSPQDSELSQPGAREDCGTVWSGLTDNYLRVLSVVPDGIDLHNRIAPVHLVRLEEAVLWGEIAIQ